MKLAVALLFVTGLAEGANILGIFTTHSPSHNIIHMAIVDALIQKGHNVTVITAVPLKYKNPKCHEVFIPPTENVISNIAEYVEGLSKSGGWENLQFFMKLGVSTTNMQYDIMLSEKYQQVIHGDTKFDLMILGYIFNDFHLAVAQQLKIPVVVSWVNVPLPMFNEAVGNPNAVSYVPSPFINYEQPMTFIDRLKTYLISVAWFLGESLLHYKMEQYYE